MLTLICYCSIMTYELAGILCILDTGTLAAPWAKHTLTDYELNTVQSLCLKCIFQLLHALLVFIGLYWPLITTLDMIAFMEYMLYSGISAF